MEPFILLAIVAVLVVILAIVWNHRSRSTGARPEDPGRLHDRDRDMIGRL